ncbi:MAG: hypothetical protein J5711_00155 [Bacteroidales bacterium]|nr:hypothetical protein [Bacteroidales bacterium]
MELFDEIKAVENELENIEKQQAPDIYDIQEQVDDIEYNLLPQLWKKYHDFSESAHEDGDPDRFIVKKLDDIGDSLIQIDTLIYDIRVKFGLESTEENSKPDNDELVRTQLSYEVDTDDIEESSDDYEIVLREISKSALKTIGLEYDDENTISLMRDIIIGIGSGEDDVTVAGKAFAHMVMTGIYMPMENIKEMCVETREKCEKQLFGLQIAYGSMDEYHCSAEEALMQIQMFL